MSNNKAILMCLVFLLGTSLSLFAQDKEKAAEAPAYEYTVEGTITFIEIDGTVIIRPLKTRGGPDRIVYIKDYTEIVRNNKPAKQEDLKPGDQVWVGVGQMRDALKFKATGP